MLCASERGLTRLEFVEGRRSSASEPEATPDAELREDAAAEAELREAVLQLEEYFGGRRRAFGLPLHFEGTPFQRRVWEAIGRIPYGCTASYARLALDAGAPNAYRAAGTACGANPIAVIVPCHRVVGSDGGLHGFGGGLSTKTWLLRHEGALLKAPRAPRRLVLV